MALPGSVTDPARIEGEFITISSGEDEIRGYIARPKGADSYPGVIIVHEAFGLVEHEQDIARRFAQIGYVAFAPDLYSREGGPDPTDFGASLAKMFALPDSQALADLNASAQFLRAQGVSKVGCLGFCSGGRQTLLFACNTSLLDAAIDAWGGFVDRASPHDTTTSARPTPVVEMIRGLSCPLFLAVGSQDENPAPALVEQLSSDIAAEGGHVEFKVYADAGHAFFADWRPNYKEAPAHEFWEDATAFLEKHLRSPS